MSAALWVEEDEESEEDEYAFKEIISDYESQGKLDAAGFLEEAKNVNCTNQLLEQCWEEIFSYLEATNTPLKVDLDNQELTDSDLERLAALTIITELILSCCSGITDENVAKLIKTNLSIKTLVVSGTKLDSIKRIAEALEDNQTLTHLDLSDNELDGQDLLTLLQPLKQHNTTLQHIGAVDWDISDFEIDVVLLAEQCPHVKTIDLERHFKFPRAVRYYGSERSKEIFDSILPVDLTLASDSATDDSVSSSDTTVYDLIINEKDIEEYTQGELFLVSKFVDHLCEEYGLDDAPEQRERHSIRIMDENFSAPGVKFEDDTITKKMVKDIHHFKRVVFESCKFEHASILDILFIGVKKYTYLNSNECTIAKSKVTSLELNRCTLHKEECQQIAACLKEGADTLIELKITECTLPFEEVCDILRSLSKNTSLKKLNLAESIKDGYIDPGLFGIISQCTSLEEFSLFSSREALQSYQKICKYGNTRLADLCIAPFLPWKCPIGNPFGNDYKSLHEFMVAEETRAYECLIFNAWEEDKMDMVDWLRNKGFKLSAVDHLENTILHIKQPRDAGQKLNQREFDWSVVYRSNIDGFTPLHLACMRGDFEFVEFLLKEKKADINTKGFFKGEKRPSINHQTSLMHACNIRKNDTTKLDLMRVDFKHLKLLKGIDSGEYGQVYHATLWGTGVAVKAFKDSENSHEIGLLNLVSHSNIVTYMGYSTDEVGKYYLIMEYLEGGTLREAIGRGRIPFNNMLRFTRQIVQAVAWLQAQPFEICHRDLKSTNILLTTQCLDHAKIKLVDFGLAAVHTNIPNADEYRHLHDPVKNSTNKEKEMYAVGLLMLELYFGKSIHPRMRDIGVNIQAKSHFVYWALRCCSLNLDERPTALKLLEELAIGHDEQDNMYEEPEDIISQQTQTTKFIKTINGPAYKKLE